MPLAKYPRVLKYTAGDRPYRLRNNWETLHPYPYPETIGFHNGRSMGFAQRTIITGWRTTVEYAEDGTSALQKNYYTCKDIDGYDPDTILRGDNVGDDYAVIYSDTEYELLEEQLFASLNALAYSLDGEHINGAGDDASKLFRTWGALNEEDVVFYNTIGLADWVDWAGMNFRQALMGPFDGDSGGNYGLVWSGNIGDPGGNLGGEAPGAKAVITDFCDFTGATLPTFFDTLAEFRLNTFSYDALHTIWYDGLPVGRGLSGLTRGSSTANALIGTGSTFTTELSVGNSIILEDVSGEFEIASIISTTALTITSTFGNAFSSKRFAKKLTGTAGSTGGNNTLTGITSAFTTELSVGDTIILENISGEFEIASIGSNTSLTIVGTFPSSFSSRRFGKELSGVAQASSTANTVIGTGGTAFTTQLSVGDTIHIATMGLFVIAAIASNTSLTVVGTFGSTFSLKEYSLQ